MSPKRVDIRARLLAAELPDDVETINASQLARLLGVDTQTLWRGVYRYELPAPQQRGRYRSSFLVSDLRKFRDADA